MRWRTINRPERHWPGTGDTREKEIFALLPHRVEALNGPGGYPRQWVWLERVIKSQRYVSSLDTIIGVGGWYHDEWRLADPKNPLPKKERDWCFPFFHLWENLGPRNYTGQMQLCSRCNSWRIG